MKNFISINDASDLPKYRQVVERIVNGIELGKIKRGEQLPSIAKLAAEQKTAKVTIAKAYEVLCEQGLVLARHGKGFYVASDNAKVKLNVFVLFDTFNAYKEVLYNAFKAALPVDTHFNIFFHHYNIGQFKNLVANSLGRYNFYVIMPHFDEDVSAIVDAIPKEKLLLLDKSIAQLAGDYAAIYQDFENDVFNSLQQGVALLKKYKTIHLIGGNKRFQYVPAGIKKGFIKFCKQHKINYSIDENLPDKKIMKQHAYLIFSDSDLFRFIKYCELMKWKPGNDVGLITYDETPMKEFLLNGITVISTDFERMGKTAAELILSKRKEKIANPAKLIIRKTL